eukprot:1423509-Rhodomonas_salina.4
MHMLGTRSGSDGTDLVEAFDFAVETARVAHAGKRKHRRTPSRSARSCFPCRERLAQPRRWAVVGGRTRALQAVRGVCGMVSAVGDVGAVGLHGAFDAQLPLPSGPLFAVRRVSQQLAQRAAV